MIKPRILENEIYENREGLLYFDGCNTLELAKEYGTPLYIYSEKEILRRINQLREVFAEKAAGAPRRIVYASKAFCTVAMMEICKREGLAVDVVSGGELHTAKAAGLPGDRIEFNGNNKTPSEIEAAVDYGVGRFIVDGLTELNLIQDVIANSNVPSDYRPKILFRVTPGVAADTHDHLITGKKDSKFGIPLDEDIFYPMVEAAIKSTSTEFVGLHFHVGSQLFDPTPFMKALEIVLEAIRGIKEKYSFIVKELNLGGGFGACYINEERKPFDYFLDPMVERIIDYYENVLGEDPPEISIEPGRSIVAEAGATLYTVGQIKDIPGVRKFLSVDGGMGDNIRPALYGASYQGLIANKMNEAPTETITVSGKNCETGDILIKDASLPKAETGDTLAILSTGAYGFSMASNYNGNTIPAVVLCNSGNHKLIVKRQSFDQLIENQLSLD